jgi:hypothetical protein
VTRLSRTFDLRLRVTADPPRPGLDTIDALHEHLWRLRADAETHDALDRAWDEWSGWRPDE